MSGDAVTTRVLCWRLERRDGVTIGLTAHDRDLVLDDLTYRAAPGLVPSAIVRSDTLEPEAMEAAGALSSGAITERDLLAGRWEGARVVAFAADWAGESAPVPLGEGRIGAVSLQEGGFAAELRAASVVLERAVVEETSPECRAELGDARCRVAMAGRRRFARVTAVEDGRVMVDVAEPVADGWGGGRLRWFGGDNAGLEAAVARSAGNTLWLRGVPAFAVVPGALVELVEGCDKSLGTCAGRFGNAVNFRGEPFLPGIDLLTRYPGA